MNIFFRCLATDLKRSCLSIRFIISTILLAAVFCFSSMQAFGFRLPWLTTYAEGTMLKPDSFNLMLLIPISILPGAILFCEDWHNKFIFSLYNRSGITKYNISKIIACVISTIFVSFSGRILYFIITMIITPFQTELRPIEAQISNIKNGLGSYPNMYLHSIKNEGLNIFWVFFLTAFTFALFCAFIGLLSLIISTWTSSYFVVVGSPIVLYYILKLLSSSVGLPYLFNPISLGIAHTNCGLQHTWEILLFTTVYFLILCSLAGFAFSRSVRRKIHNG